MQNTDPCLDDDAEADTRANLRAYWTARRKVGAALTAFALFATAVAVLDPGPGRNDKDPVAAAEAAAYAAMWIAVLACYFFNTKMAEARGWLRGKLGAEPSDYRKLSRSEDASSTLPG